MLLYTTLKKPIGSQKRLEKRRELGGKRKGISERWNIMKCRKPTIMYDFNVLIKNV